MPGINETGTNPIKTDGSATNTAAPGAVASTSVSAGPADVSAPTPTASPAQQDHAKSVTNGSTTNGSKQSNSLESKKPLIPADSPVDLLIKEVLYLVATVNDVPFLEHDRDWRMSVAKEIIAGVKRGGVIQSLQIPGDEKSFEAEKFECVFPDEKSFRVQKFEIVLMKFLERFAHDIEHIQQSSKPEDYTIALELFYVLLRQIEELTDYGDLDDQSRRTMRYLRTHLESRVDPNLHPLKTEPHVLNKMLLELRSQLLPKQEDDANEKKQSASLTSINSAPVKSAPPDPAGSASTPAPKDPVRPLSAPLPGKDSKAPTMFRPIGSGTSGPLKTVDSQPAKHLAAQPSQQISIDFLIKQANVLRDSISENKTEKSGAVKRVKKVLNSEQLSAFEISLKKFLNAEQKPMSDGSDLRQFVESSQSLDNLSRQLLDEIYNGGLISRFSDETRHLVMTRGLQLDGNPSIQLPIHTLIGLAMNLFEQVGYKKESSGVQLDVVRQAIQIVDQAKNDQMPVTINFDFNSEKAEVQPRPINFQRVETELQFFLSLEAMVPQDGSMRNALQTLHNVTYVLFHKISQMSDFESLPQNLKDLLWHKLAKLEKLVDSELRSKFPAVDSKPATDSKNDSKHSASSVAPPATSAAPPLAAPEKLSTVVSSPTEKAPTSGSPAPTLSPAPVSTSTSAKSPPARRVLVADLVKEAFPLFDLIGYQLEDKLSVPEQANHVVKQFSKMKNQPIFREEDSFGQKVELSVATQKFAVFLNKLTRFKTLLVDFLEAEPIHDDSDRPTMQALKLEMLNRFKKQLLDQIEADVNKNFFNNRLSGIKTLIESKRKALDALLAPASVTGTVIIPALSSTPVPATPAPAQPGLPANDGKDTKHQALPNGADTNTQKLTNDAEAPVNKLIQSAIALFQQIGCPDFSKDEKSASRNLTLAELADEVLAEVKSSGFERSKRVAPSDESKFIKDLIKFLEDTLDQNEHLQKNTSNENNTSISNAEQDNILRYKKLAIKLVVHVIELKRQRNCLKGIDEQSLTWLHELLERCGLPSFDYSDTAKQEVLLIAAPTPAASPAPLAVTAASAVDSAISAIATAATAPAQQPSAEQPVDQSKVTATATTVPVDVSASTSTASAAPNSSDANKATAADGKAPLAGSAAPALSPAPAPTAVPVPPATPIDNKELKQPPAVGATSQSSTPKRKAPVNDLITEALKLFYMIGYKPADNADLNIVEQAKHVKRQLSERAEQPIFGGRNRFQINDTPTTKSVQKAEKEFEDFSRSRVRLEEALVIFLNAQPLLDSADAEKLETLQELKDTLISHIISNEDIFQRFEKSTRSLMFDNFSPDDEKLAAVVPTPSTTPAPLVAGAQVVAVSALSQQLSARQSEKKDAVANDGREKNSTTATAKSDNLNSGSVPLDPRKEEDVTDVISRAINLLFDLGYQADRALTVENPIETLSQLMLKTFNAGKIIVSNMSDNDSRDEFLRNLRDFLTIIPEPLTSSDVAEKQKYQRDVEVLETLTYWVLHFTFLLFNRSVASNPESKSSNNGSVASMAKDVVGAVVPAVPMFGNANVPNDLEDLIRRRRLEVVHRSPEEVAKQLVAAQELAAAQQAAAQRAAAEKERTEKEEADKQKRIAEKETAEKQVIEAEKQKAAKFARDLAQIINTSNAIRPPVAAVVAVPPPIPAARVVAVQVGDQAKNEKRVPNPVVRYAAAAAYSVPSDSVSSSPKAGAVPLAAGLDDKHLGLAPQSTENGSTNYQPTNVVATPSSSNWLRGILAILACGAVIASCIFLFGPAAIPVITEVGNYFVFAAAGIVAGCINYFDNLGRVNASINASIDETINPSVGKTTPVNNYFVDRHWGTFVFVGGLVAALACVALFMLLTGGSSAPLVGEAFALGFAVGATVVPYLAKIVNFLGYQLGRVVKYLCGCGGDSEESVSLDTTNGNGLVAALRSLRPPLSQAPGAQAAVPFASRGENAVTRAYMGIGAGSVFVGRTLPGVRRPTASVLPSTTSGAKQDSLSTAPDKLLATSNGTGSSNAQPLPRGIATTATNVGLAVAALLPPVAPTPTVGAQQQVPTAAASSSPG